MVREGGNTDSQRSNTAKVALWPDLDHNDQEKQINGKKKGIVKKKHDGRHVTVKTVNSEPVP